MDLVNSNYQCWSDMVANNEDIGMYSEYQANPEEFTKFTKFTKFTERYAMLYDNDRKLNEPIGEYHPIKYCRGMFARADYLISGQCVRCPITTDYSFPDFQHHSEEIRSCISIVYQLHKLRLEDDTYISIDDLPNKFIYRAQNSDDFMHNDEPVLSFLSQNYSISKNVQPNCTQAFYVLHRINVKPARACQ